MLEHTLSGIAVGCAFLLPETVASAVLATIGGALFVHASRRRGACLQGFLLFGFSLAVIGFYWLPYTIHTFGGFSAELSSLLFALYCFLSALQFVLCGVLYRRLRSTVLDDYCLALPFSWLSAFYLFPQLFPWCLAQTFVAITPLAILAQICGVYTLDVLLLVWLELCVRCVGRWRENDADVCQPIAIVLMSFLLPAIGMLRENSLRSEISLAPKVRVGLVQGNLDLFEKGDVNSLEANLQTYRRLSDDAVRQGAGLVIWPETVMNVWIPENVISVAFQRFDPWPQRIVPLLFGGLMYRLAPGATKVTESSVQRFNSAIAVDSEGAVTGKFHKQALMPFGEYLPFAEFFPAIRALSPYTGNFAFGDIPGPLEVFVREKAGSRRIALQPLICYEDIVPSVAYDGVSGGAALLANLTNDAWYGRTAAPYEHHLLALFRALETKRSLVRVTNSGLTAVVDPFGRTVERLPLFEEGVLVTEVSLLSGVTPAVKLRGRHNVVILVVSLVFVMFRRRSLLAESTASSKNLRE